MCKRPSPALTMDHAPLAAPIKRAHGHTSVLSKLVRAVAAIAATSGHRRFRPGCVGSVAL